MQSGRVALSLVSAGSIWYWAWRLWGEATRWGGSYSANRLRKMRGSLYGYGVDNNCRCAI